MGKFVRLSVAAAVLCAALLWLCGCGKAAETFGEDAGAASTTDSVTDGETEQNQETETDTQVDWSMVEEIEDTDGEPDETTGAEPTAAPTAEPADETENKEPIDYAAVKPYEVGQIMIIMYHGITPDDAPNPPYHRTVSEFRADLAALYERGYRLCSLKDVMSGNIAVAAGYTPVVITFDDGLASSFSLEERNPPEYFEKGISNIFMEYRPVENTAFALLREFCDEHPDFGFSATFFINGGDSFGGAGTLSDRLYYLRQSGCDIGNHTKNHADLSELDETGIQEQLGFVDKLIREQFEDWEGYTPVGVSYPFGIRPVEALRWCVLSGFLNGIGYYYDFAVREGQSGAPAAFFRVGFDPLNVPRVRGSDNEATDLWWSIRYFDENPEYRYISDGDADTVAVPSDYAGNVDEEKVNKAGKRLIIY